MRTRISLGILALSSILFTGCTGGHSFSLYVHNGVTSCADSRGRYDLDYQYEYTASDGKTPHYEKSVPLGETDLSDVTTAADSDNDGYIDHVKVSISKNCDNSQFQDFIFENRIPYFGSVEVTEDTNHKITCQVRDEEGNPLVSKAVSAVQQLFGAKPAGKKSGK